MTPHEKGPKAVGVVPGVTKEEFDQACVNHAVNGMILAMQALVVAAREREYCRSPEPENVDEFCPELDRPYLDGRFTADELEAMAWCIRNNAWPKSGKTAPMAIVVKGVPDSIPIDANVISNLAEATPFDTKRLAECSALLTSSALKSSP